MESITVERNAEQVEARLLYVLTKLVFLHVCCILFMSNFSLLMK